MVSPQNVFMKPEDEKIIEFRDVFNKYVEGKRLDEKPFLLWIEDFVAEVRNDSYQEGARVQAEMDAEAIQETRKLCRDECEKDVLYKMQEARQHERQRIEKGLQFIVAEEANQARKDGFPTSRITSLAMKLTSLLKEEPNEHGI